MHSRDNFWIFGCLWNYLRTVFCCSPFPVMVISLPLIFSRESRNEHRSRRGSVTDIPFRTQSIHKIQTDVMKIENPGRGGFFPQRVEMAVVHYQVEGNENSCGRSNNECGWLACDGMKLYMTRNSYDNGLMANGLNTFSPIFDLINTLFRTLPLPVHDPIHDPPPHLPHLLLPLPRLSLQPFQPFGFTPAIPRPFDCRSPVTSLVVFPGKFDTDPISFKEETQSMFFYEQRSGDVDKRGLRV